MCSFQAVEATCWTRWGNEHKYQKAWSQVENLYSICDDGDDYADDQTVRSFCINDIFSLNDDDDDNGDNYDDDDADYS